MEARSRVWLASACAAARCRRACQTIARNIPDMSGTSKSSPHSWVPSIASCAMSSPVTIPCAVSTTKVGLSAHTRNP